MIRESVTIVDEEETSPSVYRFSDLASGDFFRFHPTERNVYLPSILRRKLADGQVATFGSLLGIPAGSLTTSPKPRPSRRVIPVDVTITVHGPRSS